MSLVSAVSFERHHFADSSTYQSDALAASWVSAPAERLSTNVHESEAQAVIDPDWQVIYFTPQVIVVTYCSKIAYSHTALLIPPYVPVVYRKTRELARIILSTSVTVHNVKDSSRCGADARRLPARSRTLRPYRIMATLSDRVGRASTVIWRYTRTGTQTIANSHHPKTIAYATEFLNAS